MDAHSLLLELHGRILPLAEKATAGIDLEHLTEPPAAGKNSIAWLIWHIARIQDHHVSALLEEEQIWITDSWAPRFGLDPDPSNTGYGHSPEEVASVRPDRAEVLLEYLEAVDIRTRAMLQPLTEADLDRIVDRRWDPPVTMGVRLISVADDSLQHVGQAAYVKGLLGL